jgi:hypothetical protein
MSFYDINRISYESLANKVKNSKPYRGSSNAYPLGDRTYSARHFRALEDGSFSIWYMHREVGDKLDKGELKEGWYVDKKPLGIVRPDNSFEFTEVNGLHQGENNILSELLGVYIHQVKAKGGAIMTVNRGVAEYPIFTGLRIDIETKKPLTQFIVVQPTLNRKKSNAIMKSYKEFLDVYPVYIKAMNDKAAIEVIKDLHDQTNKFDITKFNTKTLKETVDKKHYVDAAFINYLLHNHWIRSNFRYQLGDGGSGEPRMPRDWQESVDSVIGRHFRKTILGEIDEAFDWVTLSNGKLCTSPWDHKIVSPTGEEFKQL